MKKSDKKKLSIQDMILIAMFAAVISVLSILSIPTPSGVPFTLQTFAIALCGYFLGKGRGAAAAFLYLLIGAVGLPVFSGMKGGFGVLAGPTGGFIVGFIAMAAICGFGMEWKNRVLSLILGFVGLAVCHIFGFVWYAVLMSVSLMESFLLVSAPYLIKDVISLVGAYLLALILKKTLGKAGIQ